jgi:hypothetical protein
MVYTEDKLCAENAEECWKRIKKSMRSGSKLYLSVSLQMLRACDPWKSNVQSSLSASGTGHVLHFRTLIKSYKKSFIEENVTAKHRNSAPENYEFRISTVIYWQSK